MKYIIGISRIIVGSLFIVSGLIKSNDAVGFSFKLKEYFEIGALNLPGLEAYALPLAVLVCIAEVLLGVAVLLGALPKLTSTLVVVLMVFFTWLTFYTDNCDPNGVSMVMVNGVDQEVPNQCVLECGCFGNAIPLTPNESFKKDLFLMIWSLVILVGAFFFPKYYKLNDSKEDTIYVVFSLVSVALFGFIMLDWVFPTLFTAIALAVGIMIKKRSSSNAKQWFMAAGVLLVCAIFQWFTIYYLPVKDYRPYAVGQDIPRNMASAEDLGLEAPVYMLIYNLKHKETGETQKMNSNDYISTGIWKDKTWEIVGDAEEVKVSDGYEPTITDFAMEDENGNDVTEDIIHADNIVWIIQPMLEDTDASKQESLNALAKAAKASGARVIGLTASTADITEQYRHDHQIMYDYLTGDQKVLQTIVRSNPGVLHLKKGIVQNKWGANTIPAGIE